MRRAQARLRQRITNLVDELHWQTARWLTNNYQAILLPTFETHDMSRRAGRRIRSKTARMMLTFRHYEFKQRLRWKAWQRGVLVIDVNEAYTSKTRSWDGGIKSNLGGAIVIRGRERVRNGSRREWRSWDLHCGLWEIAPSCVACLRRLQRNQHSHWRTLVSV